MKARYAMLWRGLAAALLHRFATRDLQLALRDRLGVQVFPLGLGEVATLQIGNGSPLRVDGPCLVTLNQD